MISVLESCKPRPEIIAGTFNPDMYTISLSPIIDYYNKGKTQVGNVYTDAKLFFEQATYPTQGLRQALSEIFGRISGDLTAPAIHRLETAFGGGKTHTLVACTHIAMLGDQIQPYIKDLVAPELIPSKDSVKVIGIAGDEIPVHKTHGDRMIPYTLWGEMAYQIGGEALYKELEEEAVSFAAPGKPFLERIFKDTKALIMLDELAQYAARLEASRPDGAGQLAAFLMALNGYARNNSGIAVVVTLASAADAFARQTEQLARLISEIKGTEISEDAALGIGEQAIKPVASVVARDAVQITPVQASEISAVFAKRLFVSIDQESAVQTAEEYFVMYQKNRALLPEEAVNENMKIRIIANYPFHPSLVDYLTIKLTSAENFQGTRGVLRVLALAVRSLWQKQQPVPMIHVCHLDLRSERVVNELLNRTGSSDLLFVLNADVGGVDTNTLAGGRSNAQIADQNNPHPDGYPMYEFAWKTVFLNSIVGRSEGLESRIFGVSEADALLQIAFPGMSPGQIKPALDEIRESAFYMRYEHGKYYANVEPTINSVLAQIRRNVGIDDTKELLKDTARKIISRPGNFLLETDVSLSEHIPDKKGKPTLALISLEAEEIDVEALITTCGENRAREQQNLVLLLVPETVKIKSADSTTDLFNLGDKKQEESRQNLENLARQVKAMRMLEESPQLWGLDSRHIETTEYKKRHTEREQALSTLVASVYNQLYFPSTTGHIICKEIKTGGGEGGTAFLEEIRRILTDERELLTRDHNTKSDRMNLIGLFFDKNDTISIQKVYRNFMCIRSWPILDDTDVLESIIRTGTQQGEWCLYRINEAQADTLEAFYDQNHSIPLGVSLNEPGYGLVTVQGAKQRSWTEREKVDIGEIRKIIYDTISASGTMTVQETYEKDEIKKIGQKPEQLDDALANMVKSGQLMVVKGGTVKGTKPELISGSDAVLYVPKTEDVLVTKQKAEEEGWIAPVNKKVRLEGAAGGEVLLSLLRQIGSLYNKGAKTSIECLELTGMELPSGGQLRIVIDDAPPETIKLMGEFFEVLDGIIHPGEDTEGYLEISDPDESCPFIQALKLQK